MARHVWALRFYEGSDCVQGVTLCQGDLFCPSAQQPRLVVLYLPIGL